MKRFDQVDGLRGVACMLVICQHVADEFAQIAGSGLWLRKVAGDFNVGLIGVIAFFAISGFVIPSSLRGERQQGVKQFLMRRFWRLYPPFWFALLATWLMDISDFSAQRLGWNTTMVPSFFESSLAAGHFWTLEIELVFYLFVAVLFLLFGKLGWKVIVPVFVLLGASYVEWPKLPFEDHWRALSFYLGVMFWGASCREIMRFDFGGWVSSNRVGLMRAIAIGLATGLLMIRPLKDVYIGLDEFHALLWLRGMTPALGILLFLFWVVLTPVYNAALARVGRWTYSTYLLHAVVFYAVLRTIQYFEIGFLTGWPLGLYVLVLILLCFAVGGLAFKWIELPSDRVGKRLTGKEKR